MKLRWINTTGRIGANNVIVGAITTSSISRLLLMVLTPPLVNLLILMLVDHSTSTRTFEPTRPGELSDTRMLRLPHILLSWNFLADASADDHPEQTKNEVEEEEWTVYALQHVDS